MLVLYFVAKTCKYYFMTKDSYHYYYAIAQVKPLINCATDKR